MRRPVQPGGRSRSVVQTIPAAVHGIVENVAVAEPDMRSATVLTNWFPTQRGVRVRGGSVKSATIGEAVKSLFRYDSTSAEKFFAASSSSVYEITSLNATTVPAPSISAQSSGYYGTQMMATSGGEFLVIANGDNFVWYFDDAAWNPITSVAVNDLDYDALTDDFAVGETVAGGTSGATATVLGVVRTSATTGTLKLGTITGGPFQDDEALTSAGGAAVANGASSSASSITITGVSTDTLSAPWKFANRLFFVEKDTHSAWYLPVDSIGGAASEFSLAGVFKRGGALLFGGSWSLDSGDGMDDKCVFVSDGGEVAIYSGTDPSSAADWVLQGRYDIAPPLGINANMQAGGDFLIATDDGIVPLSQVVIKDPAALSLAAVTRPIERTWAFEVAQNSGSVELVKWAEKGLGFVVLPTSTRTLAVNLQTGGWGFATGWDMQCAAVFNRRCFGGFADGTIRALDEGGVDNDQPFTAQYCHAFSGYGSGASFKQAAMMRVAFFASGSFAYDAGLSFDYAPSFNALPSAASLSVESDYLIWDQSNWDEKLWYSEDVAALNVGFFADWLAVAGGGTTLAPTVQITSFSVEKLLIEMVHIDIAFHGGDVMV